MDVPADRGRWSDERLLAAIAGQDREAFGVFYRRHLPVVVGYLLRETGDAELSADLGLEPIELDDADLERVWTLADSAHSRATELLEQLPTDQRSAVTRASTACSPRTAPFPERGRVSCDRAESA
jgi:hypothetical protein